MNNDKSVHVATGVWYELSFGHTRYHHFPCHMQYEQDRTGHTRYISALESCEPIDSKWGAGYHTLNGAHPRSTKELIELTKNVCTYFLAYAEWFAKIDAKDIVLPMVSISMKRLVTGRTCFQGEQESMNVNNRYAGHYHFIYSKANCIVTPSNISDVLGKKIEHIHVVDSLGIISWDQKSELDPNTSLYVYNYDKYDTDGGVYVKKLNPDTEIVNANLCLISPKQTKHIPAKMSELFRQKTAPIVRSAQSRNR